jgi:DNA-binding MarR family transcriptional regulator/N-acetylglutamate synthase-like GNAT family acetyltransferase
MTMGETAMRVEAVRRFNRFYTQTIGVLREGLLESPFSLTEVRVLYEIAHRPSPTASEIVRSLGLDAGYVSRMLRGFEKRGLVVRTRSLDDGRRSHLALTEHGREMFAQLDERAHGEVGALLDRLSATDQDRLVEAIAAVERLLGERPAPAAPFVLRPPQPGDMGWVVHRHGAIYAREYGWDERFEALVAEVVAKFMRDFDPTSERCWIAERDGRVVGSIFLCRRSKTIAQLRLLLVEPEARGLGIGAALVDACTDFARQAGYRKIMLWTNRGLDAARHLYEAAGYRLVSEEPHDQFGSGLIAQVWELKL